MLIIDKDKHSDLFRHVTDSNLLRQYDFLQDRVNAALAAGDFTIDHVSLLQLNFQAVALLSDTAGQYRLRPIAINNSPHQPPDAKFVLPLMNELLSYLSKNWQSDAIHLAASVLWRLNWVHPFAEGNGRTARAASLLVLCLKYQVWLPGSNIIPKQIRDNRTPYYAALRKADDHYGQTNGIDVSEMEAYLTQLLTNQLAS